MKALPPLFSFKEKKIMSYELKIKLTPELQKLINDIAKHQPKPIEYSGSTHSGSTSMTVNGLTCTLHSPVALKSKFEGGKEVAQGLPPSAAVTAYSCADYSGVPEAWMKGDDKSGSFFLGVSEGRGLWLDFNGNKNHTHNIAVLISIQGVNPVTGKPFTEGLQQYKRNCPKHNIAFEQDRYCSACNHKWDAQNYIASASTPEGLLWLDGFKTEDGVVRQYIITTDESRGVAAQIIGNDRVYAIGIQFFLSKNPKPAKPVSTARRNDYDGLAKSKYSYGSDVLEGAYKSERTTRAPQAESFKLEIGGGAKIEQRIYEDPTKLTEYEEEPAATIYINYVSQNALDEILSHGKLDRNKGGEGPLGGLKLGNF